jgi:tryptophanyl-tRNA synthetase
MKQQPNLINEDMTKSDIDKAIKVYLTTDEFKTKVEKIVKDKLKNDKELEDKVVEISANVLTQLFKTLWVKRGSWRNNLSNKNS